MRWKKKHLLLRPPNCSVKERQIAKMMSTLAVCDESSVCFSQTGDAACCIKIFDAFSGVPAQNYLNPFFSRMDDVLASYQHLSL